MSFRTLKLKMNASLASSYGESSIRFAEVDVIGVAPLLLADGLPSVKFRVFLEPFPVIIESGLEVVEDEAHHPKARYPAATCQYI
jgi:hypothetical protein